MEKWKKKSDGKKERKIRKKKKNHRKSNLGGSIIKRDYLSTTVV